MGAIITRRVPRDTPSLHCAHTLARAPSQSPFTVANRHYKRQRACPLHPGPTNYISAGQRQQMLSLPNNG